MAESGVVVGVARYLAVVRASPEAVAAHDKPMWMGLFAPSFVVEDPVGGSAVSTAQQLSRFWDAFIEPNEIYFEPINDFARGASVMRDVTIRTRFPSGTIGEVPAHVQYDLVDDEGVVKIARLAAHWEVGPMLVQVARTYRYRPSTMVGNLRMMRTQGVRPSVALVGCATTRRAVGRRAVDELVMAAARGDAAACARLDGHTLSDLDKVIVTRSSVSASCLADGRPAVAVFDLARNRARVEGCTLFTDVQERRPKPQ